MAFGIALQNLEFRESPEASGRPALVRSAGAAFFHAFRGKPKDIPEASGALPVRLPLGP
jgi:hypothetical protein